MKIFTKTVKPFLSFKGLSLQHVLPTTFTARLLTMVVLCLGVGKSWGQTVPSAFDMTGGASFTFTGFAIGTTTTYPANMQGHKFAAEPTILGTPNITNAPNADFVLANNASSISSGSIRNEVAGGISVLNSGSNNLGGIVVSINTTGRTNVLVTFTAQQLNGSNTGGTGRANGMRLQYRVGGTNGTFTDVSGTEYLTTNTTTLNPATTFTNIALPTAVDNQPIVQLRWIYYISSGTTGSRNRIGLDEITVSSSSAATSSIDISTPGIGATTEFQGATNVVLQRFDLAVTSAPATLNGLTVTTAGTYAAADLTNLKVRYSADAVLDGADATLSTKSTGLGAGSQVFPSFTTQSILSGNTGYIFVTADIAATATAGNTINIDPTAFSNISFSGTVIKTGTDPVAAAGTKTFAVLLPDIAISGVSPAAGNINQNSTSNILYALQLDVTTNNATLNSAAFTTAGTYQVADLQANSFKLWINSTNSLSGATQLGTGQAIVASGNSISFSGLGSVISTGTTRYLLVTADVAYNATAANTVSITSTPFSSIVFASGNKTGTDPVSAGNDQTIAAVTPSVAVAGATINAGAIGQNTVNNILYQMSFAVTANSTNLTGVTVTTGGTYAPADIQTNGFKLWYNTVNTFSTATNIASLPVVSSGGNLVFTGFTQLIGLSTTGFIWVTSDIASGATVGNTINITSTAFSNILLDNGAVKTGTDPVAAGGLKTIQVQPSVGEILINQLSGQYAVAADEYIELVNTTNKAFDLSLLKIGYQSAAGSPGSAGGTLSGTLLPNSFWLLSPNATVTAGLTSSLARDGSMTSGMAQAAGQIALLLVSDNTKIDGVGYGTLTGGTYFETAAAGAPPTNGGLVRVTDGVDNNNNSTDFVTVTNANIYLRNSASRLANAGTTIAAGTYSDISVTGNSSIAGSTTLNNRLTLTSGAFAVGANTLTVNGTVSGPGSISGSSVSNLTLGGTGSTLNFTTGSQVLKNLTLNSGATATLGTPLDITAGGAAGVVTVASGATLTTGGNLTLKSDANGTARVANSAGTISGNAIVERYISNIGRKWRLLSGKAIGSTQTIRDAWQEGGAAVNNLGTWITAPGGGSGFDGSSINAGLLRFNASTPSWVGVTATNSGSITDEQGYMLFVRGDRNDQPVNASNAPTVLRTTGTLNQGTQPGITIPNTNPGYSIIGNPYASPIDFEAISGTTNLSQFFYVWDASYAGTYGVGGFRLVQRTGVNTYTATPTTGSDNTLGFIHSGQAFFVKTDGVGDASLVLDENSKASSVSVVNPIVAGNSDQQLYTSLVVLDNAGTENLADAVRVRFGEAYKAATTDDAPKISNFAENIASYRNNKKLIVELRPMIQKRDTIFLFISNMAVKNYRFKIAAIDFVQPGVKAWLQDTYTGKNTPVDLAGNTIDVDFSVNSDPASADNNRFRIVFDAKAAQSQTIITVTAAQKGNTVAVEWKAVNQNNMKQYEVERSNDGVHYARVNTQVATGTNLGDVSYSWLDTNPLNGSLQNPADNFYRIRSVDVTAAVKITEPVLVKMGRGAAAITVYPNPVINGRMSLKFTAMEKGSYQLRLFSTSGQVVFAKAVNHGGGTALQTLVLDKGIAKGSYKLEIVNPDNRKTIQTIIITE